MQCPACAAPASEGQAHCARCNAPLSTLAGAYAAPTSSTEQTIMFNQAPWPPSSEEPSGSWTPSSMPPAPPSVPSPSVPPPAMPVVAAAPVVPVVPGPEPGESTQWWTPAMDDPSGANPLPPLPSQARWTPPPPVTPPAPAAPAAPVVPDSWFAEPLAEREQEPTGPFPAPELYESEFASGGYSRPDASATGSPFGQAGGASPDSTFAVSSGFTPGAGSGPMSDFSSGSTFALPNGSAPGAASDFAAGSTFALPNGFTPEAAPANGFTPQPSYGQPGSPPIEPRFDNKTQVLGTEPPFAQAGGLATEPPYAQPNGLASEPPYAQANGQQPGGYPPGGAYPQPQGFSAPPSPGAISSAGFDPAPWGASQDEKPLWDPNGPMPMTQSHRQPSTDGGRGKNKPLLIGVSALVALALVAVFVVLFNNGDSSQTAVQPARSESADKNGRKPDSVVVQQAKQINTLLSDSARSRAVLSTALVGARNCGRLPQAINTMQQVAQQRQAQLSQVKGLDIPKLPRAERLRATLARSIQLSLDVDLAFLAWARSHQGCKGKTPVKGGNYKRGTRLSNQASQAKSEFLGMWNRVAPQYGLAKRESF